MDTPLLSGNLRNETPLGDELGRRPFAKGIAQLIMSAPKNDCFVIGIEGGWGEGKSYAIELIRREIAEHSEKGGTPPIKWMVFNPWHFTDSEHLASLFLRELAMFLERETHPPEKWPCIKKKIILPFAIHLEVIFPYTIIVSIFCLIFAGAMIYLGTVFDYMPVAYASLLPTFIGVIRSLTALIKHDSSISYISKLLRRYADRLTYYEASLSTMTAHQLKEEISEKLAGAQQFSHIVVAVEDLDRLTPREIRAMVKLMRMVADFPKIVYLVGYDRNHVVQALGGMAGRHADPNQAYAYGEGYLQKVVHAAYQLPRPDGGAYSALMLQHFRAIATGMYGDDFERDGYWQSIWWAFKPLVTSPRMGERIVNRSRQLILALQTKSNPADVLIASYLMEFQPMLWNWLWSNYEKIMHNGKRFIFRQNSPFSQTQTPTDVGYLQDQIQGNNDKKDRITNLLTVAIPSLRNSPRSPSENDRRSFRMGVPEYFEIYFRYEQNAATESPEFLDELLAADTDSTRDSVIQRMITRGDAMTSYVAQDLIYYNNRTPLDWQTQALQILNSLGKNLDVHDHSGYVFRVAVHFIHSQPNNLRAQCLTDLFTRWIDIGARYLPMRLLEVAAIHSGRIAGHPALRESDFPQDFQLTESEFLKLRSHLERNINQWIHNDSGSEWLSRKHVAVSLFMWLRLIPNQARAAIDDWIKDDLKIFELLKTMIQQSTRATEDTVTTTDALMYNGLKLLLGMDGAAIRQRVNEAAERSPYIAKDFADVIREARNLPDILPD